MEIPAEEELRQRKEDASKLKQGSLFDLAMSRFFIAKEVLGNDRWKVIEFTRDNCVALASEKQCEETELGLDDMGGLNIRSI